MWVSSVVHLSGLSSPSMIYRLENSEKNNSKSWKKCFYYRMSSKRRYKRFLLAAVWANQVNECKLATTLLVFWNTTHSYDDNCLDEKQQAHIYTPQHPLTHTCGLYLEIFIGKLVLHKEGSFPDHKKRLKITKLHFPTISQFSHDQRLQFLWINKLFF